MKIEAHVMGQGHKCHNPYTIPASYIKAGEMMSFHNWTLWYQNGMYRISNRKDKAFDFTRFDCAAAKLHELGKAHASNSFDSYMNS